MLYRVLLGVFSLLLLAGNAVRGTNLGPPKLIEQSPNEVWFQKTNPKGPPTPLTLKCIASENTESFIWLKDGVELDIDGSNADEDGGVAWERPGQNGSIIFAKPTEVNQGFYQCYVSNIFGTAVSNKIHARMGVLGYFARRGIRQVSVEEGAPLSLDCQAPFGRPKPTVFWLYREKIRSGRNNSEREEVVETIRRRHIAVDGEGRLHITAVEIDDGRDGLLYECAASSPVLRGEYRAGERVQLRVVPRQITSVPIRTLYTTPDEVTIRTGEKLRLQCIFGARPRPIVFWEKEDGELPKDRMKDLSSGESDFGMSLVIENIVPDDAGTYFCRAQHLQHAFNVRVLAAPYWEAGAPIDLIRSEGQQAELRCSAGGSPVPLVSWSLNGILLHELLEDNRRLLLDNGRILRINDLRHDIDTGVYQCNASNPLGYVYGNAFLNVKAHAPRFLMPARRDWRVVLRSDLDLDCQVDAAPEALVHWVDEDDKPIQALAPRVTILANNTLRILDVHTIDEGLYYCNVSNKYGINRAYNRLQIYKPTYFVKVPEPKELIVEAGAEVELECQAVSDERLSIVYSWTLNGRVINSSSTFKFPSEHTLRISGAVGRHSGIFECRALTDVDLKRAAMHLIVKDVPSSPELAACVCSERKVSLAWSQANAHGSSVRRYSVEMHTDFEKGKWTQVFDDTETSKKAFDTDITLTPWVNYTFRVIAENNYGRSDKRPPALDEGEVRPTCECRTRPSFPYTNPSGVSARGDEPDNLVVRWRPLEKYYWNAPNLQYLIRYKLNDPSVAWSEFLIEDAQAEHAVIRDQPTFREYLVQVRSVNSIGVSIVEPETVVGFSGEDAPTEAPEAFAVAEIHNFSAVTVSWRPVASDSIRGYFLGYEIEFWPTDDSPPQRQRVLVPSDNSAFLLHPLRPHTNYSAYVATRNRQYSGPPSRQIAFEMPEGAPSAVSAFRVMAVGAHSLLVQWGPPAFPNGFIRGYFISFMDDRNQTEETYVLHRQTDYLHEKASSDSPYKVSVWAETKAGEGPKSVRPVRTFAVGEPYKPSFRITNVSTTTADIEWLPWKAAAMPGASFMLNYTLAPNGPMLSSAPIFLPATKIRLESLRQASRYILVGVARDGKYWTASDPFYIDTETPLEVLRLNQDSLRSTAWFISVLAAASIAIVLLALSSCCMHRRRVYLVGREEHKKAKLAQKPLDECANEDDIFLEYSYGYKK